MATPLRELVDAQDGVVTRAQVLASRVSVAQWDWQLSSGRWRSILPGVAVVHTGEPTPRQLAWAACLAAGSGARLTGDAALSAAGMRLGDIKAVDVVVPHGRRVVAGELPGEVAMRVHRSRALDRLAASPLAPPMLAPHAAVLHAAAVAATDRDAEWRIAAVVQQRLSAPVLIREVLRELPQLNRRALVRTVLDDVELGAHAGSELELLRFLRRHHLPLPDVLQLRVRVGAKTHYLDARYERFSITLEVDGAHHREARQWEADALRTLRLAAALPGERVLRITPGMLRHDEEEVARLLRAVLI